MYEQPTPGEIERDVYRGRVGDALAGIAAATIADRTPRVLITTKVGDQTVYVVERVVPTLDGPSTRHGMWHAVVVPLDIEPAHLDDEGRPVPSSATASGVPLATSTVSPAAALTAARQALAAQVCE